MQKSDSDLLKLEKLLARQRDNYEEITFERPLPVNKRQVASLLEITDKLTEREADFVVVPKIEQGSLEAYAGMFREKPFYVLSLEAPQTSYAFSQLTNALTEGLRRRIANGRLMLPDLRVSAQRKTADFNSQLKQNIDDIKAKGYTKKSDIAAQLNAQGLMTRRGEAWEYHNLHRALKQIEKLKL